MPPPFKRHVFICTNERPPDAPRPSCARRGSSEVLKAFKDACKQGGLDEEIRANKSGCLDSCERGVSVVVYPEAVWYGGVTVLDVAEIVAKHLVGGTPVERLQIYRPPPGGEG